MVLLKPVAVGEFGGHYVDAASEGLFNICVASSSIHGSRLGLCARSMRSTFSQWFGSYRKMYFHVDKILNNATLINTAPVLGKISESV